MSCGLTCAFFFLFSYGFAVSDTLKTFPAPTHVADSHTHHGASTHIERRGSASRTLSKGTCETRPRIGSCSCCVRMSGVQQAAVVVVDWLTWPATLKLLSCINRRQQPRRGPAVRADGQELDGALSLSVWCQHSRRTLAPALRLLVPAGGGRCRDAGFQRSLELASRKEPLAARAPCYCRSSPLRPALAAQGCGPEHGRTQVRSCAPSPATPHLCILRKQAPISLPLTPEGPPRFLPPGTPACSTSYTSWRAP